MRAISRRICPMSTLGFSTSIVAAREAEPELLFLELPEAMGASSVLS